MQTLQQNHAVDQAEYYKPVEHAKAEAVPQQAEGDDYGANPIPMSATQLSTLLDEISLLDVNRVILEPGVMLAETGVVLNLDTIRSKVQSPSYTLPEMLHDLNAICEPFLNHSPEHAQYATNFLERANESIVNAVRDAQVVQPQAGVADGGYVPASDGQQYGQPGATGGMYGQIENGQMGNGYMQNGQSYNGHVQNGHVQNGQMQYGMQGQQHMVQQTPPSQHYQDTQGYHGGNMVMQQNPDGSMSQVMMPSPNGAYPMHTPPPSHSPYSEMPHMFDSSGGSSGGSGGRKRPRIDGRSPGSGGSTGSGAPRTRLEGRRCAVCAVIKKAGCGTENAHFRCLKRKLPEGAAELERRVGELVDVGQEERVTVWNPKEGRKLSGQAAPMLKNLVGWLASHPGWEAHPRGSTPGPRKISGPVTELPAIPSTS